MSEIRRSSLNEEGVSLLIVPRHSLNELRSTVWTFIMPSIVLPRFLMTESNLGGIRSRSF